MKKTGIFYHPSFSKRSYLTIGTRLSLFPNAFKEILKNSNIKLYESKPVSKDLILRVHTEEMLEGVKRDFLCSTAWHSAGGVVQAAEKIWEKEIDNAFVYIGSGGHHSGRNYHWGYCCFNDVALAIENLREKYNARRFAILDTDAHHGDGTREIFANDSEVLHVCFCGYDEVSKDGTKVDVGYSWGITDEEYLKKVEEEFSPRARKFKPDLLFWYFGHDTHKGDYGSIGLTTKCYFGIADLVRDLADEICNGSLEVVLGGGSRTDVVTEASLGIIARIAEI
ncbi:MAG: histone deacetylase [Candidatus Hydrothermarchaeota archaeon]